VLTWFLVKMSEKRNTRAWCFVPGKPVVRGYDSSRLFREGCLLRIQHPQMEVEVDLKKIKQAEKDYAAAEEQLRRRKKEFGWID